MTDNVIRLANYDLTYIERQIRIHLDNIARVTITPGRAPGYFNATIRLKA